MKDRFEQNACEIPEILTMRSLSRFVTRRLREPGFLGARLPSPLPQQDSAAARAAFGHQEASGPHRCSLLKQVCLPWAEEELQSSVLVPYLCHIISFLIGKWKNILYNIKYYKASIISSPFSIHISPQFFSVIRCFFTMRGNFCRPCCYLRFKNQLFSFFL